MEPPHWPIIFVVYGTRTFESVGLSLLPFAFGDVSGNHGWSTMIHPILSQSDGEREIIMFQARRVFAYLFCSFELNYLNTRFKIRGKRKYNNLMCLGFFFF